MSVPNGTSSSPSVERPLPPADPGKFPSLRLFLEIIKRERCESTCQSAPPNKDARHTPLVLQQLAVEETPSVLAGSIGMFVSLSSSTHVFQHLTLTLLDCPQPVPYELGYVLWHYLRIPLDCPDVSTESAQINGFNLMFPVFNHLDGVLLVLMEFLL